MKPIHIVVIVFSLVYATASNNLTAQQESQSGKIVDLKDFELRSWDMAGFSLDQEAQLKVKARGATSKSDWIGKAWIINADNRIVVWELDYDNTSRGMGRAERVFNDVVTLPSGNYEVYYGTSSFKKIEIENFGEFMDGVFSGFKKGRSARKWGISIEPNRASDLSRIHPFEASESDQAIVQITRVGDDAYEKKGFSISQPMEVRIYALGEGEEKGPLFDYGWIVNEDTRETVWEMQGRRTKHAGGARKNRLFDDKIKLSAGNYVVYYITDDSHSYDDFNMMPPYDIWHYGITIWAAPGAKYEGVVKPFMPSDRKGTKIVDLTQAREEKTYKEGFELLKPMKLRIYAIGEYSNSHREMCDYGWIQNPRTQEIIWKMTYANTRHAGGADKNRMVDTVIDLPAGPYLVYYITDTGHSYRDWNASPPFDPEYYGISIWIVNGENQKSDVRPYSEDSDPNILAKINSVNDDEFLDERFQLKEKKRVRIYAIGEGDHREMFDYGWIEDENGDMIWEMEYDKTTHAGGAQKNRLFNDTIELKAGSYKVLYKTDSSHAFDDWNAKPPDDPYHWGIMIILQ